MHTPNVVADSENANPFPENSRKIPGWQHVSEPAQRVIDRIDKDDASGKFCRRQHDPAELALYAEYEAQREKYRPPECGEGAGQCWVRQGPPAFDPAGGYSRCSGCGGRVYPGR